MAAKQYRVEGRSKANEMFYASGADFVRADAENVPAGRVLEEPGWSPYCVDPEARELLFVRMPAGVELADAAFYHLSQYRNAEALIAIPLDKVASLARELPDPRTILIFSMGRCGTTLVSHALNGADSVYSLSEPAVFEHRPLRALAESFDVPALLGDMTRLLFAARTRPAADTLAVKFRSQALFVAELFWQALPHASYVFMYRDAVSWGESFLQFIVDVGVPLPLDEAGRDFHWMMMSADGPIADMGRFIDLDERPIDTAKILAPGWTIHVEQYLRLRERGIPFLALRYNELTQDRAGELARLFAHCGVPADGISSGLTAFDEDSQKGTSIERKGDKRKLDEAARARFCAALGANGAPVDPNYILPDIYSR
jgi:hypothetical protein